MGKATRVRKRVSQDATQPKTKAATIGGAVKLSEIFDAGIRFEAAGFHLKAREARQKLLEAEFDVQPLGGVDGLATEAHNAFRFKRHYVAREHGVPFLTSSDIISLRPGGEKFLSKKLTPKLDQLLVEQNDVLISCSGTIGNVGFTGRNLEGFALSQDAIRARFKEPYQAGYAAAFLRSRFGQLQLRATTYGSVVVHIEPEHLPRVLIPALNPIHQVRIGEKMVKATKWRDQANDLFDQAVEKLEAIIGNREDTKTDAVSDNTIRFSNLRDRFDASFHSCQASSIEEVIRKSKYDFLPLIDHPATKKTWAVTKFRKRVYVKKGGIPLLSSKQLFQIEPVDIKRLSEKFHNKDLEEIGLSENLITVSCGGTVGRVNITPRYMNEWASSQHSLRLRPSSSIEGGFLFAWLSSQLGQVLLKRHRYGSVIVHIDLDMFNSVPVPVFPVVQQDEIGKLVISGNKLRHKAWMVEQEAISEITSICERGRA